MTRLIFSKLFALLLCTASMSWSTVFAQDEPCLLLPDPGPCEAAIPAWYFDQDNLGCSQFTWGGCEGVVPFETLEECLLAQCGSDSTLSDLCDSIAIQPLVIGNAELGHLEVEVSPDYQTPYWFGYAGFALFDASGVLLAAENVNTAPNAFGFDGNLEPHSRFLDYQAGVDLSNVEAPFDFELRLYEGWMAGSAVERCRWSWTSFDGLHHIELPVQEPPFNVVETMDMMGRKIKPTSGQWVLQRDLHGRVRKAVINE